jgi:hypothetical protein
VVAATTRIEQVVMKARLSLRTLLILLTVATVVLAVIGNRLIEDRRQERLLGEARLACTNDGSLLEVPESSYVSFHLDGAKLTEQAARAIVSGELVKRLNVSSGEQISPGVRAELHKGFRCDLDGEHADWHRHGWSIPVRWL